MTRASAIFLPPMGGMASGRGFDGATGLGPAEGAGERSIEIADEVEQSLFQRIE
jgi:hypothetical protein